jgi:hypothetical protein
MEINAYKDLEDIPEIVSEMSSVLFQGGSYNRNNQARNDLRKVETRLADAEKKIEELAVVIALLKNTLTSPATQVPKIDKVDSST